jgi:hypothetical protein
MNPLTPPAAKRAAVFVLLAYSKAAFRKSERCSRLAAHKKSRNPSDCAISAVK